MRILNAAVLVAVCAAVVGAQDVAPLDATLRRGVGEPFFWVSQPAYVAVFEVIPGMGVEQVFPRSAYQAERPVAPGEYLLSRSVRSYGSYESWSGAMPYARPVYMTTGAGTISSYYYATAWTGANAYSRSRTYLLVASRTPLRLVRSPDAARHWLQQVVGFRAISSTVHAPDAMLTDIVDAIMPMGARVDDLVVDVLEVEDTIWERANRWSGQSISFTCASGRYTVPADFFFDTGVYFCPARLPNQVASVPGPETPAPGVIPIPTEPPFIPGNPEGTKLPGRRRPFPSDESPAGGRAWGTEVAVPRATVGVGTVIPVPYGTGERGGVNPATGAWVPPTPSGAPGDYGYGAGRFTPAGGSTGSGSYGRPTSPSTGTGVPGASSSGAASTGNSPAASPSSSGAGSDPAARHEAPRAAPPAPAPAPVAVPASGGARPPARPIDP